MSTYKRRIVYLSDEEWAELGRMSKGRETTISATVRDFIARGETEVQRVMAAQPARRAELEALPGGGIQARQSQRDALLRKINRGK